MVNQTIKETNFKSAIIFHAGDKPSLKLDKEGFHYNGEVIKDYSKAYNAFMKFINKGVSPCKKCEEYERLKRLIKEYFEHTEVMSTEKSHIKDLI